VYNLVNIFRAYRKYKASFIPGSYFFNDLEYDYDEDGSPVNLEYIISHRRRIEFRVMLEESM